MRDWLKQRPNSLFALTAQTWVDYNIAGFVRGDRTARETYPAALETFSRLSASALDYALKAHALDNSIVPASDAILRLGKTQNLPRPIEDYLDEIMEVSPNYGSLYRAFSSTNPGWGGNWADAKRMCEIYADEITEYEGYTVRICKLNAAFAAYHSNTTQLSLIKEPNDLRHPAIKEYRTHVALYLLHNSDEMAEIAREQVFDPEFTDVDMASNYDRFIAQPRGWPAQLFKVHRRAVLEASAQLVHDPYNPRLLDLLTRRSAGNKPLPEWMNFQHRIKLLKRQLVFQPFNGQVWHNWLDMESVTLRPEEPFSVAPLLTNAVAYSNHSPFILRSAMRFHLAYVDLHRRVAAPMQGVSEAEQLRYRYSQFGRAPKSEFMCPFIRSYRVWDSICEYEPQDSSCQLGKTEAEAFQYVLADATANDLCLAEREGPIDDLFYAPIGVDLGHPPLRIEGLRIQ